MAFARFISRIGQVPWSKVRALDPPPHKKKKRKSRPTGAKHIKSLSVLIPFSDLSFC